MSRALHLPFAGVRKQAFDLFWKTDGQYENTLGALMAQRVQVGVLNARLRKYPSAVAASLSSSEVPDAVLRMLVDQSDLDGIAIPRNSVQLNGAALTESGNAA